MPLGKIIGTLFGLVFAGFGLFFLFMTSIPLFQSWVAVQNWHPVYAKVLTVNSSANDTRASYTYSYRGIIYEGNRVYLAKFKDNIGPYHQKLQTLLNKHLRSDQPIQIWFDPFNPQNAVVDRKMRWGLFVFVTLFCSVFIVIGLYICWAAISAKPVQRKKALSLSQLRKNWQEYKHNSTTSGSFLEFVSQYRQDAHMSNQQNTNAVNEKAWLNNKEWRKEGIRSEAKTSAIGMWFFAIFWNGVSSPIFFVFGEEWQSGNYAILIALIFPLVGLYLLYRAITITREYARFGTILCKLDPFPGAIGGNVGGTFDIHSINISRASFRLELECIYSYVAGSGKNRSRRENILWAEAGNAKIDTLAKGIRLEFSFDVPDNLPQSDWQQRGEYHLWRLRLCSTLPGADLNRVYNIPVYTTGERSRNHFPNLSRQMQEEQEVQAEYVKMALEQGDFDGAGLRGSVKIRKIDRGILLIHSIFRNKLLSLVALFFGGAFSAATYAILSNFGSSGVFAIIAVIFSLPFALVGLCGICAAIYLPLNNLRVTISKGKISVLRRLLFVPIRIQNLTATDISDCSIKKSGSSGQGVHKKEYYTISAHTTNGKSVILSEGICGRDVAEHFKDYLSRRIKAGY